MSTMKKALEAVLPKEPGRGRGRGKGGGKGSGEEVEISNKLYNLLIDQDIPVSFYLSDGGPIIIGKIFDYDRFTIILCRLLDEEITGILLYKSAVLYFEFPEELLSEPVLQEGRGREEEMEVSDRTLEALIEEEIPVSFYLKNGESILGNIVSYDRFTIMLRCLLDEEPTGVLLYKSAVLYFEFPEELLI